jgi:hypothetical protein
MPMVKAVATARDSALPCADLTHSILVLPGVKGKAKEARASPVFHVGLSAHVVLYICIQDTLNPPKCMIESRMIDS